VARAESVLASAGVRTWNDLNALKIERVLKARRDGGLSAQTSNHQLGAVRQFVRWAVSNGLAPEDPLRILKPLNVRVDRRRIRRALEPEEIRELLRVTERGPVRQGLSGPERALLYRVALGSGLRANELRSLRAVSLQDADTNEPTLTVQAGSSKRRREDIVPIRVELARDLAAHVCGRKPWEPMFALLRSWRPCGMLCEDLAAAEIPQRDGDDHVIDFHSLRVSYISALARANVPPKVVQALARHSTLLLTYDRYVKLGNDDERRALDVLPDLGAAPKRVALGVRS
jgi:integrase